MPVARKHRIHRDLHFEEDGLHVDGDLVVDGTITSENPEAEVPAHATSHQAGGTDPIPLDTLAAPSDNTTLDASLATHGLLPKLPGGTATFLRADGTFAAPAAAAHATSHEAGGSDPIQLDDLAAPDDNTDLNASTTAHGLLRKLPGGLTTFLRGDGAFATPVLTVRSVVVDIPYPALHSQSVVVGGQIGVVPSSQLLLFLAGVPETFENAGDMLEILSMYAIAGTSSFELKVNSRTPFAGSLPLNYIVAT